MPKRNIIMVTSDSSQRGLNNAHFRTIPVKPMADLTIKGSAGKRVAGLDIDQIEIGNVGLSSPKQLRDFASWLESCAYFMQRRPAA